MFRLIHGSSGLRPSTCGYEAGTHKGCNPAPPGSVEVDGFSKSEQVSSALSDPSDLSDSSDRDVLSLFPLIYYFYYLPHRSPLFLNSCVFYAFCRFFVADLTSDAPLSGLVLFFWSAFCIKCQQGYYSELSEILILTFSRNTLYKRDSRLLSYLIFL